MECILNNYNMALGSLVAKSNKITSATLKRQTRLEMTITKLSIKTALVFEWLVGRVGTLGVVGEYPDRRHRHTGLYSCVTLYAHFWHVVNHKRYIEVLMNKVVQSCMPNSITHKNQKYSIIFVWCVQKTVWLKIIVFISPSFFKIKKYFWGQSWLKY